MNIFGIFGAAVMATHSDRPLRGCAVTQSQGGIGHLEDAFIGDVIFFHATAKFGGGDFLQFLQRIHGGYIVGTTVGKDRIAATLGGTPWQMAVSSGAHDLTVFPVHL